MLTYMYLHAVSMVPTIISMNTLAGGFVSFASKAIVSLPIGAGGCDGLTMAAEESFGKIHLLL